MCSFDVIVSATNSMKVLLYNGYHVSAKTAVLYQLLCLWF